MSDNLVQRLRSVNAFDDIPELTEQAADRIEALEAAAVRTLECSDRQEDREIEHLGRISELEAALREIAPATGTSLSLEVWANDRRALEGKP